MINQFKNFFFNLCFLLGRCTEFNVGGGVIQSHSHAPCNEDKFPNCTELYNSSVAYKCKLAFLSNFIVFMHICFP